LLQVFKEQEEGEDTTDNKHKEQPACPFWKSIKYLISCYLFFFISPVQVKVWEPFYRKETNIMKPLVKKSNLFMIFNNQFKYLMIFFIYEIRDPMIYKFSSRSKI
jgi:hypothetical protein